MTTKVLLTDSVAVGTCGVGSMCRHSRALRDPQDYMHAD